MSARECVPLGKLSIFHKTRAAVTSEKLIVNDGEISKWKLLCINKGRGAMMPGETIDYCIEH